ncbi:MAG: hypothetical protein WA609_12130 [Terriglobales bacterium]
MSDIEMREAELVLVELENQWDDVANRTFALMRELETAENRLVATFMDEWRDRGGDLRMMRLAYSHFRKRLLLAAGKKKKDRASFGFSGFPTMTTSDQGVRGVARTGVVGKVFAVIGH